jgi:methylmalonyl-CoA mutase cobalamin-binding subunit
LIQQHWHEVQRQVSVRKLVQTGVNDFPDAHERIELASRFARTDHVRLGLGFETLRIKMQTLLRRPRVALPVVGDYAGLNARLSFTKNFFELLGLEVVEPGQSLAKEDFNKWAEETKASIWAVVAADDAQGSLEIAAPHGVRVYLAGKISKEGVINVYAGMDVKEALADLLTWWEGK